MVLVDWTLFFLMNLIRDVRVFSIVQGLGTTARADEQGRRERTPWSCLRQFLLQGHEVATRWLIPRSLSELPRIAFSVVFSILARRHESMKTR